MASFRAYLDVGGNRYPLLTYELAMHQETDSLGRPASPVLGGVITCTLNAPDANNGFLHQWMFSPTKQEDGRVMLMQQVPEAIFKTISFFNAYCVRLNTDFVPGTSAGGSLLMHLKISPQRVAVGAIVHDNDWPLVSHGAGETFQKAVYKPGDSSAKSSLVNDTSVTLAQRPAVASDCTESQRIRLQNAVTQHCKTGETRCTGTDSCSTLESKMTTINACIQARTTINMTCFRGGDAGHREAIQAKINSLVRCQGFYFSKCRTQDQPEPVTIPSPAPVNDPDFMERMRQLTGLTGAALILYLILSEGSRILFPPRNLIPIP